MYCYVLLMDIYGYSWCFSILFYRSISILLKYLHSKWGTESPRDSQGAGVGPGSSFPTAFVPTRDTLDSLCLEFGFNYSGRRISKRTNNMTLKNTWTAYYDKRSRLHMPLALPMSRWQDAILRKLELEAKVASAEEVLRKCWLCSDLESFCTFCTNALWTFVDWSRCQEQWWIRRPWRRPADVHRQLHCS